MLRGLSGARGLIPHDESNDPQQRWRAFMNLMRPEHALRPNADTRAVRWHARSVLEGPHRLDAETVTFFVHMARAGHIILDTRTRVAEMRALCACQRLGMSGTTAAACVHFVKHYGMADEAVQAFAEEVQGGFSFATMRMCAAALMRAREASIAAASEEHAACAEVHFECM